MKLLAGFAAVMAVLMPLTAAAQEYPNKPVTLVVPYPPGGNVDSAARIIAPHMESRLGQPIVVENRAGAGGMIAAEHVVNANPDGYTLFVAANGPLLFSPITFERPDAYDWKTDFETVGPISLTAMVLTARANLEIKTLEELIARLEGEDLLMASPGAGTTNHLAAELLQDETGTDWRIVHYGGNAPSIAGLLGGETAFSFDQISVILPHIEEGSLTPLAVTSRERDSALPDVPTLAETGVADFQAVTFTGLFAPDGTPGDVIAKLNEALSSALQEEEVNARFAALGASTLQLDRDEFVEFVTEIDDTWRPVITRFQAAN